MKEGKELYKKAELGNRLPASGAAKEGEEG